MGNPELQLEVLFRTLGRSAIDEEAVWREHSRIDSFKVLAMELVETTGVFLGEKRDKNIVD